ncbi:ankyrin repeat and LEM domain-containing protein 2 homolog isoform X2 [Drosophila elegans]|uniref:ankyrin repeat and LEM domain-containing protein 2 homolog isoform X2 n=1 Tax=Drosophila elegans TaxID=30023 RepID=UPI0007E75A54|nr:ankyrin repeat and LEM domain-containing protein 2 homolog isoform X2 [Drosophila elegans]
MFFGVYIPNLKEGTGTQFPGSVATERPKAPNGEDHHRPDSPLWLIFTEKTKALDVLKHYKEARFREFPTLEQAESYVQFGFESIEALNRFGKAKTESKPIPIGGGGYKSSSGSTDSLYSSSPTGSGGLMLGSSPTSSPTSSISSSIIIANGRQQQQQQQQQDLSGERPPFRAPTKQELQEFRKQIEGGHIERVKRIVWENPRFLISSGDTPTSLKEGCRYNAMHICAQVNKPRIAQLLLKTITDPEFAQLYAGKKGSRHMCAALNRSLLDYYLNMPDKARGETPLHFAAKNGHADMVEVLISYPECKSLPNLEGKEPKEIICLRNAQATNGCILKITMLLDDPYFVPVLRCMSNTIPPQVGKPFSPSDPPNLQSKTSQGVGLSEELTISALAGPMPRESANNFHRRWKTPPRVSSSSSSGCSPFSTPNKINPNLNHSTEHGRKLMFSPLAAATSSPCEKNNNNNNTVKPPANFFELPATPIRNSKGDVFTAYRDPINGHDSSMADISGLLDTSFGLGSVNLNDSFRERSIKNSDIEKGLEMVGRELARKERWEWREYWDFLDTFVDLSSSDGLARLDAYLRDRAERQAETACSSAATFDFDLLAIDDQQQPLLRKERDEAPFMTPYTCVEKSLQVFAKRIAKVLINKIGDTKETLLGELKRLKSLIASFKADARFLSVDFSKVHSRIANLVALNVVNVAMKLQILQMLRTMRELLANERGRELHLGCLCGSLLQSLEQATPTAAPPPDSLKTEELCSAAWQTEQCCHCLWDASLSRQTSRRKRTKSLRSVPSQPQLSVSSSSSTSTSTGGGSTGAMHVSLSLGAPRGWRRQQSDDEDNDSDDDGCFFECNAQTPPPFDSSEDENFYTPPGSVCSDLEPRYKLYIFGDEPTKRDLNVLNAIGSVDVDKETYPFVHAWKSAMESFSTFEMNLFPSPKMGHNLETSLNSSGQPCLFSKKLIATPKLSAVCAVERRSSGPSTSPLAPRLPRTPSAAPTTSSPLLAFAAMAAMPFKTPRNKVRGLFSQYRESRCYNELDSPIGNGNGSGPEFENSQ